MTMASKYKAVFLDIDGTLIDSNDAHAQSWKEVLDAAGISVDFKEIRSRIGKGGDKLLPEVTGIEPHSDRYKEISAARSKIFKEKYLPHLKPFPKVRELLQKLRDQGLKLVAVTSAKKDKLDPLLEKAGVKDLIRVKVTSDDVKNSKPDPDLVECALEVLKLSPSEVIMLGDTPYDIEAAEKAGVKTIAFRAGGWKDTDLKNAIAIYQDPEVLLENLDSSVLYSPLRLVS